VKIATVIGARPQFIKAGPVSIALRAALTSGSQIKEVLIHTGQHYDPEMSQVFFDELRLSTPDYNLGINGGTQGQQTGRMLEAVEEILASESPDCVLTYGDTNSTLAGALAGAKLHIPVAHIEAGLRSFNRRMPEEINRVMTDHLSQLLFAPTETAMTNLNREGVREGVFLVGDVMQDAIAEHVAIAERKSRILQNLGVVPGEYFLATVHRAENTDDLDRLVGITQALSVLARETAVIWPVHPRTGKCLERISRDLGKVGVVPPIPYLDMLALERGARVILTDSGGVQKEARWLGVPCVTLRDETEWIETLEGGWNRLAGADTAKILEATAGAKTIGEAECRPIVRPSGAAIRIAKELANFIAQHDSGGSGSRPVKSPSPTCSR
jgi:UDP-GlcNAc3NAcA epimerase